MSAWLDNLMSDLRPQKRERAPFAGAPLSGDDWLERLLMTAQPMDVVYPTIDTRGKAPMEDSFHPIDALAAGVGMAEEHFGEITGLKNFADEGRAMRERNMHQYEDNSVPYHLQNILLSAPESLGIMAASTAAGSALGGPLGAAGGFARGLLSQSPKIASALWKLAKAYQGGSTAAKIARTVVPASPKVAASVEIGAGLEARVEQNEAEKRYIENAKRNGTYIEGQTEREAREIGNDVFWDNMGIISLFNAPQYNMIFGKPAKNLLGTLGRFGLAAGSEGAEEVAQEIASAHELGEPVEGRNVRDAFVAGAGMGGIFHGVGRGVPYAIDRITGQPTQEQLENERKAQLENYSREIANRYANAREIQTQVARETWEQIKFNAQERGKRFALARRVANNLMSIPESDENLAAGAGNAEFFTPSQPLPQENNESPTPEKISAPEKISTPVEDETTKNLLEQFAEEKRRSSEDATEVEFLDRMFTDKGKFRNTPENRAAILKNFGDEFSAWRKQIETPAETQSADEFLSNPKLFDDARNLLANLRDENSGAALELQAAIQADDTNAIEKFLRQYNESPAPAETPVPVESQPVEQETPRYSSPLANAVQKFWNFPSTKLETPEAQKIYSLFTDWDAQGETSKPREFADELNRLMTENESAPLPQLIEQARSKIETAKPVQPQVKRTNSAEMAAKVLEIIPTDSFITEDEILDRIDDLEPSDLPDIMLKLELNGSVQERAGRFKRTNSEHQPEEISRETPKSQSQIQQEQSPAENRGKTAEVITGNRTPHQIQYRVMEADALNSSHTIDNGNVFANKNYPAELQPRDRARADMQAQLIGMSENLNPADLLDARDVNQGAPTVRNDGVVLNGNGRVAAIRRAYEIGKGKPYKTALVENAERFGLNSDAISRMKNPVLVREITDDLSDEQIRDITGTQTGGAKMGASEQSQADAKKLSSATLSTFPQNDNVDLSNAEAVDFLRSAIADIATPDERNALTTSDGKVSQDGINRVKRALFALAYGNDDLIARMSESTDDNIRGVTNALLNAAPTVAKLQSAMKNGTAHNYDLSPIVEAVKKLSSLRGEGKTVANFLQEQSLFAEHKFSDEAREILTFLDRNKRAPNKTAALLKNIAQKIRVHDPREANLFGGETQIEPLLDIIKRAAADVENRGMENLFDRQETTSQPSSPTSAIFRRNDKTSPDIPVGRKAIKEAPVGTKIRTLSGQNTETNFVVGEKNIQMLDENEQPIGQTYTRNSENMRKIFGSSGVQEIELTYPQEANQNATTQTTQTKENSNQDAQLRQTPPQEVTSKKSQGNKKASALHAKLKTDTHPHLKTWLDGKIKEAATPDGKQVRAYLKRLAQMDLTDTALDNAEENLKQATEAHEKKKRELYSSGIKQEIISGYDNAYRERTGALKFNYPNSKYLELKQKISQMSDKKLQDEANELLDSFDTDWTKELPAVAKIESLIARDKNSATKKSESAPKKTKGKWHTVMSSPSREELQKFMRKEFGNDTLTIQDDGKVFDGLHKRNSNYTVRTKNGRWQLGYHEGDLEPAPKPKTETQKPEEDLSYEERLDREAETYFVKHKNIYMDDTPYFGAAIKASAFPDIGGTNSFIKSIEKSLDEIVESYGGRPARQIRDSIKNYGFETAEKRDKFVRAVMQEGLLDTERDHRISLIREREEKIKADAARQAEKDKILTDAKNEAYKILEADKYPETKSWVDRQIQNVIRKKNIETVAEYEEFAKDVIESVRSYKAKHNPARNAALEALYQWWDNRPTDSRGRKSRADSQKYDKAEDIIRQADSGELSLDDAYAEMKKFLRTGRRTKSKPAPNSNESISAMNSALREASEKIINDAAKNPDFARALEQLGATVKNGKVAFPDDKTFQACVNLVNSGIVKSSQSGNVDTTIKNFVDPQDLNSFQRAFATFAKEMGVPIIFFRGAKNFHGAHANGISFYNADANFSHEFVYWHEFGHWLKNNQPELFGKLSDAANVTDEQIAEKKKSRTELSDEELREEIICDAMGDVARRAGIFQQFAKKNQSLIQRLMSWAKSTLNKFTDWFHTRERGLTTAQRAKMYDAFGKIARQIEDADGNKIFRYNNRTHEVELIDGQKLSTVQNSAKLKYSTDTKTKNAQNSVDSEISFNDNEDAISKRIFDKYLGDDIMKSIKSEVEKEIGEHVKLAEMSDPVARDETRDKLPYIRRMLVWYNQKNTQNDPVLKNHLAIRIEYARRCFENDERIKVESLKPITGNERPRGEYNDSSKTVSRNAIRRDNKGSGGIARGLLRNVSGGKSSAHKQFLKLYDEEAKKHSERQGAFSVDSSKSKDADKPKYSLEAGDNSNESFVQRIRNKISALFDDTSPSKQRDKKITELLSKISGYRIAFGHFANGDISVDDFQKIIRSRHAYDWEKLLPVVGKKIARNLKLDATDEMGNYIAEWILTGALNNTSAEANEFAKAMRENPATFETLDAVREIFKEISDMTPLERIKSKIVSDRKKTFLQRLGFKGGLKEEFVDDLAPLEKMVDDAIKVSKPEVAKLIRQMIDPYKTARLLRGKGGIADVMLYGEAKDIGKIRAALQEQYPNVKFERFTTLEMIIDEAGGVKNLADFETFCVAKQMKEIHEHNRKNPDKKLVTTFSEKDCDDVIKSGEEKFGAAQKDLVRFSKTLLSMQYDSGLLTKAKFFSYLNAWKNYIPLARVFEENEDYDFFDSMQERTGSKREIYSPIQKVIANTTRFIAQAERNKAKLEIATLARCGGLGWIIAEVDSANPNVDNIVYFKENGRLKKLETPDVSIARAVNSLQKPSDSVWVAKVFKGIMGFMRAAYTASNPDFAVGNIFRDFADAFIHNKFSSANPLTAMLDVWRRGLLGVIRRDADYFDWIVNGGSQTSFVSEDVDYAQRAISDLTRGTRKQRYLSKNFFSQVLDDIQKLAEYSEYATRLNTYKTAKDKLAAQNGGKATVTDKRLAALESRDASVDFARSGRSMRVVNKVLLFSNAAVQGLALDFKTFNPKKFKTAEGRKELFAAAFRMMTMSVLPAALMFALNHSDDDRRKKYKNRPDWEKDTYWIFGDGFRIPKGMDLGIRLFSALTDEFFAHVVDDDPFNSKRIAKTIRDAAPSITATIITPAFEAYANYSIFRDAPIVPLREQKLPANLQFGAGTSPAAKFIGEKLNYSPRKIDYLISGYLGFMGRFFSGGTDELPMVRRFIFDPYKNPRIVKEYYEALDEQTKLFNEYKLTKKPPDGYDKALHGRLKSVQESMRKFSKLERKILEDPKLSADERTTKLHELEQRRVALCEKIFKRAR